MKKIKEALYGLLLLIVFIVCSFLLFLFSASVTLIVLGEWTTLNKTFMLFVEFFVLAAPFVILVVILYNKRRELWRFFTFPFRVWTGRKAEIVAIWLGGIAVILRAVYPVKSLTIRGIPVDPSQYPQFKPTVDVATTAFHLVAIVTAVGLLVLTIRKY